VGCETLVEARNDPVSRAPRPSSTMCVLHQGDSDFEVLMVRRSSTARFMAGAWVFPGGVVDVEDHEATAQGAIVGLTEPDLGPWLAAAFREVVEETGIWLTAPPFVEALGESDVFAVAQARGLVFNADRVAYFANWITPTMVPQRFDARFFMAVIDEAIVAVPDGREIDRAEYVSPAEALRRAETGEWLVPFPTQRTLDHLAGFASVTAAVDEWQHRQVIAIQPRLRIVADGSLEVVMPDDPGYAHLEDVDPDPDVLARAARAAAKKGRPLSEVHSDTD
jgi:recombination protein RecT